MVHPVNSIFQPVPPSSGKEESSSSLLNRVGAIVLYIFQAMRSLVQRFIDSNWQFFVVESEGNFDPRSKVEEFGEASRCALEILRGSESRVKEYFNDNQNVKKSIRSVYNMPPPNGSCFGNCVAMAHSLSGFDEIRTVDQLKDLEREPAFVKTAQTMQLVSELCAVYNESCISNKDKIPIVRILEIFKVIPSNKLLDFCSVDPVSSFFSKMKAQSNLNNPTFRGGALIGGIGSNSRGHSLLLEIDHSSNTYILYDNNLGFYQWNTWDLFLEGVQKRLISDCEFSFCNVAFFRI